MVVHTIASHLGERRKMMQIWADYLDRFKAAEYISISQ